MTVTGAMDVSTMIDRRVTETSVSGEDQGLAPYTDSLAADKMIMTGETIAWSVASPSDMLPLSATQSAAEWAAVQWGEVELGDERLDRRAVQIGAAMAAL